MTTWDQPGYPHMDADANAEHDQKTLDEMTNAHLLDHDGQDEEDLDSPPDFDRQEFDPASYGPDKPHQPADSTMTKEEIDRRYGPDKPQDEQDKPMPPDFTDDDLHIYAPPFPDDEPPPYEERLTAITEALDYVLRLLAFLVREDANQQRDYHERMHRRADATQLDTYRRAIQGIVPPQTTPTSPSHHPHPRRHTSVSRRG